jgi:hypothetical protein
VNGQIAGLIASTVPTDIAQVQSVFGPNFQTMVNWRSFLRTTLNDKVSSQLGAPAPQWSVRSFQALYVACWVHHPVEKGSFMIDLGALSAAQRNVIEAAYKKHCSSRKSSHLSGSGRSASEGWAFLQGYKELLVQYETTKGHPYLFLKSEGHTTGVSGIIPHMQSWVHKKKHGEGLQASPALNAMANPVSAWSAVVEGRAAENYAKHYKDLLKGVLNFSGKQITAREMMKALFQLTGFAAPVNFEMTNNNQQLGTLLTQYCNTASVPGPGGAPLRAGNQITPAMIMDLRQLAQTLQSDGAVHMSRVYREIRATPAEIDQSLARFYASPG